MHGKHKHTKSEVVVTTDDAAGNPKRWLLPVLLVAQLMVILDITAVNIALPHIAGDLHMSGSSISWTITSYSLIFGSLLLFGGRAADLIGRRRMFLGGLVIFTTSSVLSAVAGSAATLFMARAGQGLGAALLSPAALSIITAGFHGAARAKAQAAWGAVGGAGAAIGVLVGGVLTQAADWRMIFYVNIPVAILLFVASTKLIAGDVEKPRWRGLDLPGAALATTSLAAVVYGITQAHEAGWTSVQTHLCGIGGVAGLIAFAIYELHTDEPLLNVRRLADRSIGGGLVLQLVAAGSIFGLFLLCSLYLQSVLGWGPLNTGLAFVPLALAAGVGAHVSGHAISKHGVRGPLAAAFGITAIGMFLLSRVGEHGSYVADLLPGMLIAGLGLGIAVVTVSMAVLAGARKDEAGMISGLASTGHEIGGTLGIAIFSTIAAGGGAILGPQVATGISDAFSIAALVATLASGAALVLLPQARHFLAKLALNPQAMPVH
jgi:EmrB/QacA subfamily drug resistance transporter